MKNKLLFVAIIITLCGCNASKQIARSAKQDVLDEPALKTAHVGISIFEPATDKYWYNYQGDHYFTPASNTKIATCYVAMKYLGDSLVGLKYGIPEENGFKKNTIVIRPTGDPTFLHEDYKNQPVFKFLQNDLLEKGRIGFYIDSSNVGRWGDGWSWNDYQESYMAERSTFPVLGDVITFKINPVNDRILTDSTLPDGYRINLLKTGSRYFDSLINKAFQGVSKELLFEPIQKFSINRDISSNSFSADKASSSLQEKTIPFVTNNYWTALNILDDTLRPRFKLEDVLVTNDKANKYWWEETNSDGRDITINSWNTIHSQPTDSVLKPMMHRSDNFFAEQCLLMVSNELLGVMNDEKIIDTLLKTDFKDLPQKPRWADGSGLSRYNLFSPQDLVFILNKMKNDFGMERIKNILPTGSEGTLSNYYLPEKGYIFAKTGSLSGVVTISGFLYTKKNKLLIFSVLVNNHNGSATEIRRAVEKFMEGVRNNY